MSRFSLIILVAILGLVALFTFQNSDIVSVKFFTYEWNTTKLAMIAASFAAGVLCGWLVWVTEFFRKRRKARLEKKRMQEASAAEPPPESNRVRELETEVTNLKNEIAQLNRKIDEQARQPESPEQPEPEDAA